MLGWLLEGCREFVVTLPLTFLDIFTDKGDVPQVSQCNTQHGSAREGSCSALLRHVRKLV